MKVGFVAPLGIAAVNGGVRTQALQTAEALGKLNVEVDFVSPWQEGIEVDITHVFVAGPDTLGILRRCSELGIKTVLSPVFFSNRSATTIASSLKAEKMLSKVGSGIRSDFGIKAEACQIADLVLPNTPAEAELIEKGFEINSSKILVVPNGVETRFKNSTTDSFIKKYGFKDFVLFVGQAGAPRKNVIKLLEVAPKIKAPIVIIGSLYDDEYGQQCKKLANTAGNITFIDTIDHDSELLSSAYAACHTFVLPSKYETPGIAAMEAALAGANIAITEKGGTRDYFKDWVEYLNPQSNDSIVKAVNLSLRKKKSQDLKNHILNHYSWGEIGRRTLDAYNKL
ncbi:MAG: glycosyltransferase family 4 protein [Balneolaceae bacterium]|nr:glycosyltransferase family 4 protein [Balneolaceae bacterium]MBO6547473.1 glycosyltransferase family 4 protein [Balneolaceae bacterium]MBO6647580.1 glycosyltransferase family 4 protein [Balneolaceae bacterium]